MTLASFPMTSISFKAHKIDFSYFLFTVDATFLYYVQSRNLAEKISIPAELVVPVRVTQTLYYKNSLKSFMNKIAKVIT